MFFVLEISAQKIHVVFSKHWPSGPSGPEMKKHMSVRAILVKKFIVAKVSYVAISRFLG